MGENSKFYLKGSVKVETTNLDYSNYLVIFVDILGSKNRSGFNELYTVNSIFHEEFEKNQKLDAPKRAYYRKIYTFSDCAYIFYSLRDKEKETYDNICQMIQVALCNCEPIFLRFLKEKIVFRGGIAYGKAYVDPSRSMFFGEAVNKAYILESDKAVHPRIVVDESVAQAFSHAVTMAKTNIDTEIEEVDMDESYIEEFRHILEFSTGEGLIEKDIDGQYIYNYLHSPENNIIINDCYSNPWVFLNNLLQFSKEQIEKNDSMRVIDKYIYLRNYVEKKFDSFLQNS